MTLDAKLEIALACLFERLPRQGRRADPGPLRDLCLREPDVVSEWFVSMMTDHPLAGVQLGRLITDEYAGFVEHPVMFEWGDASLIAELNTESYPGLHTFPLGYLTVGCGVEWGGNVLVLAMKSPDPPVYEVWHDISHDPATLVAAIERGEPGTRLIAPALSVLFTSAIVESPAG